MTAVMVRIQIQLTESQAARLGEIARADQISQAEVMRRLFTDYLARRDQAVQGRSVRHARVAARLLPLEPLSDHDRGFVESLER